MALTELAAGDFPSLAERLRSSGAALVLADALERGRLDYTVGSLNCVDEYLRALFQADEGMWRDEDYGTSLLSAAAYLGEVIRRNAPMPFSWVSREGYRLMHPERARSFADTETMEWLLAAETGEVFAPLDRVMVLASEGRGLLRPFVEAVLGALKSRTDGRGGA